MSPFNPYPWFDETPLTMLLGHRNIVRNDASCFEMYIQRDRWLWATTFFSLFYILITIAIFPDPLFPTLLGIFIIFLLSAVNPISYIKIDLNTIHVKSRFQYYFRREGIQYKIISSEHIDRDFEPFGFSRGYILVVKDEKAHPTRIELRSGVFSKYALRRLDTWLKAMFPRVPLNG